MARSNAKTAIIDISMLGGQPSNYLELENYPGFPVISGYDLMEKFEEHADKFGVEKFPMQEIKSVDLVSTPKVIETLEGVFKAKSVIIACGAHPKKLGVKGEEEFLGRGVSYCATCDGAFFRGKDVAVAGGGNTALEDAKYLSDICNKVYLIHRRDEFRGEDKYLDEIKTKSNIEIILNSQVTSINGNDVLESITINDDRTININGLFIAVGQEPKNEVFANVIDIDEKGYIKTDDGVHTNVPHIYVAGDCRNKPLKQLTTAVSDGSIAATMAIKEMDK